MRPLPARILLSIVALGGMLGAVSTSQPVLFVGTAISGFLLFTSLSTSRQPLTRALGRFQGQAVNVTLCGTPPPHLAGSTLVLTSVNVIGVGTHVFFASPSGTRYHLKVAQPRDPIVTTNSVVIGSAKYVQWNAKK